MRHRVQMDKPRRTKTIVRREKDGCELLVFHGENARGFRPLPQVTDTANPTLRSRYRFTASPGKARAYLSNQSRSVSWTSIPLWLLDRHLTRGDVSSRVRLIELGRSPLGPPGRAITTSLQHLHTTPSGTAIHIFLLSSRFRDRHAQAIDFVHQFAPWHGNDDLKMCAKDV